MNYKYFIFAFGVSKALPSAPPASPAPQVALAPAASGATQPSSAAPPATNPAPAPVAAQPAAAAQPHPPQAATAAPVTSASAATAPPSAVPATSANVTSSTSATAAAATGSFKPTVARPDGSMILPPGTSFLARHTTRDDNEPGMDNTQCQTKVTKGPRDNVIGVDSKTFGSLVNGEITPMCGVIAQMTNPKTGNVAYGVILDRIWQNKGEDVQFDVAPAISQALGYGGHNIGQIQVTIVDDFPASYTGSKDFGNMWKKPQDKAYGYPVCPTPPADPSKAELKNGLRIIYSDTLKTHCVFEAGKRPLVRGGAASSSPATPAAPVTTNTTTTPSNSAPAAAPVANGATTTHGTSAPATAPAAPVAAPAAPVAPAVH